MEAKKVVITMDIYAEIRKLHREGISERAIARKLRIHRKTVHKYMNGSVMPGERLNPPERAATVLTQEVKDFVAQCIEQDEQERTKKQHHTAKRIYDRLVSEKGFTGGESTIRDYVRKYRDRTKEAFVPLAFPFGDAMQVDWGEATSYIAGERVVLNIFCARLCASEAPFVAAYRRQNFESFQDALIRAFAYFGGVPRRVIFDNARIAVKEGFGVHAKATDKYIALAAHYCFEPVFCNVASGNEKGLVEGLVGFFRRNFCVPLPKADNLEELNLKFEAACRKYTSHTVPRNTCTVGELLAEEKKVLFALPERRYDPSHRTELRVSSYSLVQFETNRYSVPVSYVGKTVTLKALPETIELWCGGTMIASHPRCYKREQSLYDLAHYLPLLEQKGRALFQAKPLLNNAPDAFVAWLKKKKETEDLKPKELVNLIRKGLEIGYEAVMHGDIVPYTLPSERQQPDDPVKISKPDLSVYDMLLGKGVSA